MKQIILAVALCLAAVLPGVSPAQTPAESAIQGVISGQFSAFLDEDVDAAWGYASPMIQNMFRTPENFGRMVENGYPMVYTPSETRFLELRDVDGALWQKVQVRDTSGQYHLLDYKMVKTEDGWLIDGVQFIKSVGVGV